MLCILCGLLMYSLRGLVAAALSHRSVYVVMVYDYGGRIPTQSSTPQGTPIQPVEHIKIFGVYRHDTAARVALTEILRLPEYAGRRLYSMNVQEVDAEEFGPMLTRQSIGCKWTTMEEGGIVAVILKMMVRKTGL